MTKRLYHLLALEAREWLEGRDDQELRPASLETEGFVHLSYAEQLRGTLETHYAQVDRLILVEIAADVPALVVEPSRGGALFPHVYAPIAKRHVVRTWELRRGDNGWRLPDLDA